MSKLSKSNESFGSWSLFSATHSKRLVRLLKALCRKIAQGKGYSAKKYFTCYVLSKEQSMEEVLFEYDILEENEEKIAIEGYLYLKSSNKFVAKAFVVYAR